MKVTAIVVAALLAAAGCGGGGPIEPRGSESCGAIEDPELQPPTHVEERRPIMYRTDPPTSGPHWPRTAPTGFYDVEIEEGAVVHNMEHGNVAIWYRIDIPTSVRDALKEVVAADPRRWLMVPWTFKDPDVKVAFTAWGHLQSCRRVTAAVDDYARAFFRKFAGKGPEGDAPGVPHA